MRESIPLSADRQNHALEHCATRSGLGALVSNPLFYFGILSTAYFTPFTPLLISIRSVKISDLLPSHVAKPHNLVPNSVSCIFLYILYELVDGSVGRTSTWFFPVPALALHLNVRPLRLSNYSKCSLCQFYLIDETMRLSAVLSGSPRTATGS